MLDSFLDLKSFVDAWVPLEIPWDGEPGDIFNVPLRQRLLVQFEFAMVAGKYQDPVGG